MIVTAGCGDDDLDVYEEVEIKVDNATLFFGEWKSLKKSFSYGSELTINKDSSFNFSYGACQMGGYSIGKWIIENDEIILNSDSIDECLFLSEYGVYWTEAISDTTTYITPESTIEGCEPDHVYEDYVWFYNERFKIDNDTIIHLNPKDTIEIECQDKFYKPLKEEQVSETQIETKDIRNPFYYNPVDDESDSNYVEYWCSIDILIETEKNIDNLDVSKVANFMATFHEGCKNNAAYSEWSNEILFKVLNNKPQEVLSLLEKNNGLRRNYILNELSNPIHDGINLDSLTIKINLLTTQINDEWKSKLLESIEDAKKKLN